jgi:O-antigen/teichoic acid export membrane protein
MSILRNSIANAVGRYYVIAVGLITLPLFLGYLGAESYGLIGFFALVMSMLILVDAGLSQTLAREAARVSKTKDEYFRNLSRLLISYEILFLGLAGSVILLGYFLGSSIASSWLKVETLPFDTVSSSVFIMFLVAALRLVTSLYRSLLMGLERQVEVNITDIFLVSLRNWVLLICIAFLEWDVLAFFSFQLFVSILEFLIFRIKAFNAIPLGLRERYRFYFDNVKVTAPFALALAYTTAVWVTITQVDKLILSHLLSLDVFAYLALVSLMASAIGHTTNPIGMAVQPRLNKYLSANNEAMFYRLYRESTQIVTVLASVCTAILCLYAHELTYAWTGDVLASKFADEILQWYALGFGILAVAAFQYRLQFAHGNMKWHITGSTLAALVQVPSIGLGAFYYGALGAGIAWFIVRLVFFIFWVPFIHSKYAPGLHMKWLKYDVLPIVATVGLTSLLVANLRSSVPGHSSRLDSLMEVICASVLVGFSGLIVSPVCRTYTKKLFARIANGKELN